jgi:hypothetical protein
MSKHTIDDLRNTLFETLQALKDKDQPMEIDRALAIKDVAQVIVNSAKVEVEHLRIAAAPAAGSSRCSPSSATFLLYRRGAGQ